jgi:hypothetical protein
MIRAKKIPGLRDRGLVESKYPVFLNLAIFSWGAAERE